MATRKRPTPRHLGKSKRPSSPTQRLARCSTRREYWGWWSEVLLYIIRGYRGTPEYDRVAAALKAAPRMGDSPKVYKLLPSPKDIFHGHLSQPLPPRKRCAAQARSASRHNAD